MRAIQPRIFFFAFLVVCFILPAWVYIFTPRGGVITVGDTISYVAAARSIRAGEDMVRHDGTPLLRWPPFYPALIALGSSVAEQFNGDIIGSIQALNYLSAVLTLFTVGVILLHLLHNHWLMFVSMGLIALSWPYMLTHIHGWSETAFIPLILIFLLALYYYLQRGQWFYLAISLLFAALASMQRYAGVTAIFTGALALMLFPPQKPLRSRLFSAFAFGVIASIPLGLWYVRNQVLTGTVAGGSWSITDINPLATAQKILNVIGNWYAPADFFGAVIIGGIILVMCSIALVKFWRQIQPDRLQPPLILILIGFLLIFCIFTLLTSSFANADISDRILIIVFVISMMLTPVALDHWLWPRKPVLLAITGLLIVYMTVIRLPKLTQEYPVLSRWCCRDLTWDGTELIHWLNEHNLPGDVWTNDINRASLYAGIYPQSLRRNFDEDWIRSWVADLEGETYLIWFNTDNRVTYDFGQLADFVNLTPLEAYDNGIIFSVEATG